MAAVALVIGLVGSPTAVDTKLQNLLTGLGHTVTLIDDTAAVSAGKDLHVIADSCSSGSIGTKYDTAAVSVIVCDVDCPDQLRMCSGTNANITPSGTTWTIIAHAITAGLTPGAVTMKTGSSAGRWGWLDSTLGAGAEVFATNPSDATRVLGVAYDTGSVATSGTMPARRVYLSFLESFAGTLNANGDLVFTQAVTWGLDTGGVTGTLTATGPAGQASASGSVVVDGALSAAGPAAQAVAAASVVVDGTFTATGPAAQSAAAGSVRVDGTLTAIGPAAAAAIVGSVIADDGTVTGVLHATAPAAQATTETTVAVRGQADITGPAAVATAAAHATVRGVLGSTGPTAVAFIGGRVLGDFPTPPERIFAVDAETRVDTPLQILAVTVDAEPRTHTIPAETREVTA